MIKVFNNDIKNVLCKNIGCKRVYSLGSIVWENVKWWEQYGIEAQYVISNGVDNWIDTWVPIQNDLVIEMDFEYLALPTTEINMLSTVSGSGDTRSVLDAGSVVNGEDSFYGYSSNGQWVITDFNVVTNKRYNLKYEFTNGLQIMYVDNAEVYRTTNSVNISGSSILTLFARNYNNVRSGFVNAKLYKFKMSKPDGTVLVDYFPLYVTNSGLTDNNGTEIAVGSYVLADNVNENSAETNGEPLNGMTITNYLKGVITTTSVNEDVVIDGGSNATIDWGDGTITNGETSHIYTTVGSYNIYMNSGINPLVMSNCLGITTINEIVTSQTTTANMFKNCSRLISIPLFNTSNVEDMSSMFYGCSQLTFVPPFNTTSVTNMSNMFNSCSTLTALPLIDVSNVTDMNGFIGNCSKLETINELRGLGVDLSFVDTIINKDSILKVLNDAITIPKDSKTLSFNQDMIDLITYDEYNVGVDKGWLITPIKGNHMKGKLITAEDNEEVTIPCGGVIDWGDGVITTGETVHTYTTPDEYNIYINTADDSLDFARCAQLKEVDTMVTNQTSLYRTFMLCTNLTSIQSVVANNLEELVDVFINCTNLASIPLFDTSNVTIMTRTFYGCRGLTTVPHFDTSSVTTMNSMFQNCTSLTTVPLFDTTNVTTMGSIFSGCTSLTTVPLFDTTNTTTMSNMFSGCTSLTTVPLFDTTNTTTMSNMLYNCTSLTTVPLFDATNTTTMSSMLYNCTSLTTLDGFKFLKVDLDLSKCTSLTHESIMNIINYLENVTTSPILKIGEDNITKINYEEFLIATNKGWIVEPEVLEPIDGNFMKGKIMTTLDNEEVTIPCGGDIDWGDGTITNGETVHTYTTPGEYDIYVNTDSNDITFNEVSQLITVNRFFTSQTNCELLFHRCSSLQNVILMDMPNAITTSGLFRYCDNLISIPLFDTSNVTNMESMFNGCDNLASVPLFDTSNVVYMGSMFSFCGNLRTLPEFNMSNVISISNYLSYCTTLITLPLIDAPKLESAGSAFWLCNSLTNVGGFTNLKTSITLDNSPLSYNSLMNIINNLAVVDAGSQKLNISDTAIAKLTSEEIKIATDKGWVVD